MIDNDDLRVAELEALAELGTADVTTILDHLPVRLKADRARIGADLARLEKKGLITKVTGFALTQEGRELLTAVAKIKTAFPGPGRQSQVLQSLANGSNGVTKEE